MTRKDPNRYPKGWSRPKVRQVIEHYDHRSDEEAIAEAEATVEVRPATHADVPEVAGLCTQWAAEKLTRGYRADSAEELRRRLAECFLVAELDGHVVGFVIAQIRTTAGNEFVEGVLDDKPAYLEVQDLYVAASHRRKGIGSQLMRHLLRVALDRGVSGSLVYSANRDYVATARFYERLGYGMWHIHMTRGGRE